jgi:hypothetical protein
MGGLLPTIIKEANSITMLTEKDLADAFIKKHELKLASDCTKLPAPLGFFPLRSELLDAMREEHFYITTDQDSIVKVSDQTGISTRKFSSRSYPQLWAWPTISVDLKGKRVTCTLTFRVNDKETFPMIVSPRLCRAVVSVHPDCHRFIQETARTESAGESWNEVGCGPVMLLSEVFDIYAKEKPARWPLAKAKLGIFNPDPMEPKFVPSFNPWPVYHKWCRQAEAFKQTF